MEELHLKAFNDLKRALCQAPALGIAQSDRPFVLYVHEHLGFMTACLMQDHGGSLRPIHYYSGKLDIVAQGMDPYLEGTPHLLPLGKLASNSHSPEYCYTACTSHEPILMYDVCND